LFSNETELRENLNADFTTAFDANMSLLAADGDTDASGNSPSKTILNQIINNQPDRLADITELSVGENWFKAALVAGDILYFRLNLSAAANQNDLTSVAAIPDRVYLIKATLTE
jgi:hypothetical protein